MAPTTHRPLDCLVQYTCVAVSEWLPTERTPLSTRVQFFHAISFNCLYSYRLISKAP
jgi:hypothetical protein